MLQKERYHLAEKLNSTPRPYSEISSIKVDKSLTCYVERNLELLLRFLEETNVQSNHCLCFPEWGAVQNQLPMGHHL